MNDLRPAAQPGFTVFLAAMTWSMPFSGWLIDRLGPRIFMTIAMTIAGVLCAPGWGSYGHAQTLTAFYPSTRLPEWARGWGAR